MEEFVERRYKVTSQDGHTSDLIIISPKLIKEADRTPIIMIHPAMGTPSTYYLKVAQNVCVRNGWHVAVEEIRGVGSSSVRASASNDWSYWTSVSQDIPAHIDQIRRLFPKNPLFVLGHSVGAILLSFYLAQNILYDKPRYNDISGFISMASGSVWYKRHPQRIVWFLAWFVIILGGIMGWFPGKFIGFGGEREAKSFIRDWATNVRFGQWEPVGCPTPDLASQFKNIHTPAFFLSIGNDLFAPHESTRMLVEQYPEGNVKHVEVENTDFEDLKDLSPKLVHFRWTRSDCLLHYVEEWMEEQLKELNRNNLKNLH